MGIFQPRVSDAFLQSASTVRKKLRFPIGDYARQRKIARLEVATEKTKADEIVCKLTEKLKYRKRKVSIFMDYHIYKIFCVYAVIRQERDFISS
jgi:hypothetical protein